MNAPEDRLGSRSGKAQTERKISALLPENRPSQAVLIATLKR